MMSSNEYIQESPSGFLALLYHRLQLNSGEKKFQDIRGLLLFVVYWVYIDKNATRRTARKGYTIVFLQQTFGTLLTYIKFDNTTRVADVQSLKLCF